MDDETPPKLQIGNNLAGIIVKLEKKLPNEEMVSVHVSQNRGALTKYWRLIMGFAEVATVFEYETRGL